MNEPVIIREIKNTSNPEMRTVVFEQEVARPVNSLNGLLNFANAGNSSFGSNKQKRVAFFNFSPQMITELGFVVGQPVKAELGARLVVHEFCEGDIIPEEIKNYYDGAETYKPREWKVNEGTANEQIKRKEPKMTPRVNGQDQQPLTRGGQPIYRETHFAIFDMIKADVTIQHDNRVTGSSISARQVARTVVGAPDMP